MANEEQTKILKQGARVWNGWRKEYPKETIDISAAVLGAADLCKANLREADLHKADLSGADLSGANLCGANLSGTILYRANLYDADLSGANLYGANLSGTVLYKTNLSRAILSEAALSGTALSGANLGRANLSRANLSGKYLSEMNLSGAIFRGADLSEADLRRAILKEVDFRQANLIGASLNGATITDARLWETQRSGWSIQGIVCEAVYWDKDRQERTTYSPGEFERLYADKTKIVLHYEGGISPIEIATLPALIQRIEATHPGCVLRLQSVQEAPGGATVTLVVEDGEGRSPREIGALKTDIEIVSQRDIRAHRALLEERGRREQAELKLQLIYDEIFPRTVRLIMEKSQSTSINVSGGTIYGNLIGELSGENAQVHYTHNDLAALEAIVSEMSAHRAELLLTSAERRQFEDQLNAIQEQLAAQAPNHSLLREALHTVRHILEAGVAHVLVGQWLPLLHKLG